jgi:hypothetical protein
MFIYLIGKGRRRKREARKEGREINQTVQKQTSKIRKHVTPVLLQQQQLFLLPQHNLKQILHYSIIINNHPFTLLINHQLSNTIPLCLQL